MDHVFKVIVKLINTALNVILIFLYAHNADHHSTESLNYLNIFVSVIMDSMKTLMVLANHVDQVVQNVLQLLIVYHVSFNLHQIIMETVHVLLEHSSLSQMLVLDIVKNVLLIVTVVIIH